MMSRVRDTNMKIWDFLWLCYNITSPRDTGDSWHLAWELSGAGRSGHGAAGVPLFPNPCTALTQNSAAIVLYCREHIKTPERKISKASLEYVSVYLVCVCWCGREGCELVSFSPSPKVGKLRVKLWVGGGRHELTRDTDMTRVWRDAGTRDTWRDLVLCHSAVKKC